MMSYKTFFVVLTLLYVGYAVPSPAYNPCREKLRCGMGICEPSKDFKNFTCICQHGFTGRFCEQKKAPSCSQRKVPCQNNGKCHDTLNAIVCECPKGTYGRRCEILDEEALSNWGILTLEDPNKLISHVVPEEFKLLGTVKMNEVGTLKAMKEHLLELFDEIQKHTGALLKVATLSDGTELLVDVTHGTNETKDDVFAEWQVMVAVTVPKRDNTLSLDNVIEMLNKPAFPKHSEPQAFKSAQKEDGGPTVAKDDKNAVSQNDKATVIDEDKSEASYDTKAILSHGHDSTVYEDDFSRKWKEYLTSLNKANNTVTVLKVVLYVFIGVDLLLAILLVLKLTWNWSQQQLPPPEVTYGPAVPNMLTDFYYDNSEYYRQLWKGYKPSNETFPGAKHV
ncbi:unnamed protein product [Bursaphelenchus okinawaensis]|uniref:EGF-like domain-containing protein n=1 Tax=Bursaphelenchus okinawaensis TaxID=465554 RepID=A0A811K441_9BILA|nr:unnamed protein product [Bursaphelenchus okinawaensis]CAD5210263.1 unnamed protein product [Bursaphelenchus okinawaensis]CAG9090979.1 unnamed protein product [Bursaphelenchus okinawaensis]CAG9090991.1 unnamed protein product [Bursaphelenchus okinawaensis]